MHSFTLTLSVWATNKLRSQECLENISSFCLQVSKALSDDSAITIEERFRCSCESLMWSFIACILGKIRRLITVLFAFFVLLHSIYCVHLQEEHNLRHALIMLFFLVLYHAINCFRAQDHPPCDEEYVILLLMLFWTATTGYQDREGLLKSIWLMLMLLYVDVNHAWMIFHQYLGITSWTRKNSLLYALVSPGLHFMCVFDLF